MAEEVEYKTKRLVDILTELQNIEDELIEGEGELTPEIEEKLAITQEELGNKLDSYSDAIGMLDSIATFNRKEAERLVKRSKALERQIEWLKYSVLNAVKQFGVEGRFKTNKHSFSIRTTKAVEVDPVAFDGLRKTFEENWNAGYSIGYGIEDFDKQPIKLNFKVWGYSNDFTDNASSALLKAQEELSKNTLLTMTIDVEPVKSLVDKKNEDAYIPEYVRIITNESLNIK
jgi:hypothetical protein